MKRKQLIEDIAYIKSVISSSFYYTHLSGMAAIVSGISALAGCILSRLVWDGTIYPFFGKSILPYIGEVSIDLIIIWLSVFIIAVFSHIYFIARKARTSGSTPWSRLAKMVVFALSPAMIIGAGVTIFLIKKEGLVYIPPLWMCAYGLGVWCAGLFSVPEPRWLGAMFMFTGLMSLFFFLDYALTMLAISFGGYHIVYGCCLIFRYDGERISHESQKTK